MDWRLNNKIFVIANRIPANGYQEEKIDIVMYGDSITFGGD